MADRTKLLNLEILSPGTNHFLMKLSADFYRAGTFEVISDDRTSAIRTAAEQAGFNADETQRIVDHINTATELFMEAPVERRESWRHSMAAHMVALGL